MKNTTSPSLRHKPARILLDVSYTISSWRNSGIERVVRNVQKHWEEICRQAEIPLVTVIAFDGRFYEVTPELATKFATRCAINRDVLATLPIAYRSTATLLHRLAPLEFLRRWFLPEPGHLGVFKPLAELHERVIRRGILKQRHLSEFSDQDLVVMPDAYWTEMQALDAAQNARSHGATALTIIYDLIPITHPETVGMQRSRDFAMYFRKACLSSDVMVAISKTVSDEVSKSVSEMQTLDATGSLTSENPFCNDVRHFKLGADIATVFNETNKVSDCIRNAFASDRFNKPYLMVSAFDPRKNHRYLLDAFDLLWKEHPSIKLCLAGRKGKLCLDILNRISIHPQLNRSLFVFHQATDAELVYCYRNAAAAIMPSIVEGFGLPIVESLNLGCAAMASDIPVHREVGGANCKYFDLRDPRSLADLVLEHHKQVKFSPETQPKFSVTTWQESTEELFDLSLRIFDEKSAKRPPLRTAA